MTKLSLSIAAALLLVGPPVGAEPVTIQNAYVNAVMVTADDTDGGCMASLSIDPATRLPGCGANWVTFSCNGELTTELRAYRMLDQAQLALANGKRVQVVITNEQQHNGYCFVSRIDVLR